MSSSTAAEIAAAMAACGLTAEQVAAVLSKLQVRSTGADRQARYRARKASLNVTGDVTRNVTEASPTVTNDASPRTPIRERVLNAQNLDIKQESKINSSLRSESSTEPVDPIVVDRKSKPKGDTAEADRIIDGFLEGWSELASQNGLQAFRAVTDRRRSCILARSRDLTSALDFPDAPTGFAELFAKIRGSPFLLGHGSNGGRSWKCDLDWIINETNFLKVMEGKYAASQKPAVGFGNYRRTA